MTEPVHVITDAHDVQPVADAVDAPVEARPVRKPKKKRRKAPADHQPKKVKPQVEKTATGSRITIRGVTVEVDDDAMDDFELIGELAAVDGGSFQLLPSVMHRLLGPEQVQQVMNALRGPTGRVPVEAAAAFLGDLLEVLDPS